MKKIIWVIIIIAIIAGAVFLLGRENGDISKNNPIKIGAILPLTGDLAFLGEEIKKGIDLGVAEYKDRGININVIYEDDQSLSLTASVNAANKLLNIDKVDVGLTMLLRNQDRLLQFLIKKGSIACFYGIATSPYKNLANTFLVMVFQPNLQGR